MFPAEKCRRQFFHGWEGYTREYVSTPAQTLGICAERNAIFNMITNGEHKIDKVLAVLPDGSNDRSVLGMP